MSLMDIQNNSSIYKTSKKKNSYELQLKKKIITRHSVFMAMERRNKAISYVKKKVTELHL